MSQCLAIIPARGGSKRIPRKNIRPFAGRPIIQYSIDAALAADCFDEVMVSTEDPAIARLAKRLGAAVAFLRSRKNAGDRVGTVPVLVEVLSEYKKRGREFTYICCLYPTAPFVTAQRLKQAKRQLVNSGAEGILPIMPASCPVQQALKLERGTVKMFWPKYYHTRAQDLQPTYLDTNQFYFLTTASLLEQKTLYPKKLLPLFIPAAEGQDINTEADWQLAELKFRLLKRGQSKK